MGIEQRTIYVLTTAVPVLGPWAGGALLQADGVNSAPIYLGGPQVTADATAYGGVILQPGSSLPVSNPTENLYAITSVGAQLLRVILMPGAGQILGGQQEFAVRSTVDQKDYLALLTHDRHLLVSQQWPYGYAQYARLLLHDGFDAVPLNWAQAGGTVALDVTRALSGGGNLKLTAAAGAGNTAIARKFFPLPADQAAPPNVNLKLVVSVWWNALDVNLRDVQLILRPDDSTNRWEATARYWAQQASVSQGLVQYENGAGAFVSLPQAWLVPLGSGSVGDPWHFLMLVMNYQQSQPGGAVGYFTYHYIKHDDWSSTNGLGVAGGPPVAKLLATAGVRQMGVDLLITGDNAAAASVFFDEFLLSDLAGVNHLA